MRRLLIRVTVASVVINAAIGVAVLALTSGDLSETEGKLLGTSLLVSAMSISAILASCAGRRAGSQCWCRPPPSGSS